MAISSARSLRELLPPDRMTSLYCALCPGHFPVVMRLVVVAVATSSAGRNHNVRPCWTLFGASPICSKGAAASSSQTLSDRCASVRTSLPVLSFKHLLQVPKEPGMRNL